MSSLACLRAVDATPECTVGGPANVRSAAVAAMCAIALLAVPPAFAQNSAPTITSSSAFDVAEGSAAVATLTATDAEGDALTWSIADPAGDDGGLFTLSAGGELAFADPQDYEDPADSDANRVYAVTVQVTDGADPTTADLGVTVTNLAPGLSGPATASHAEGKRGLRIAAFTVDDGDAWSLAGDDAAKFTVDRGFLRFVDPPDFENASDSNADNVYGVTVQAGDGTTTETTGIAVTVTDLDEPGLVTLSPPRPKRGVAMTATLTEADVVSGTPTWRWERNDGREGWDTIDGAASATYTPTAADADRYLRATAGYTDKFGSGKTARAMASHVVIARRLSALRFTGLTGVSRDSRAFYPNFDPDTLHYAARCTESVTLTLRPEDADTRLSVNGVQRSPNAAFTVDGLDGESDIRIRLTGSAGDGTTYTVHCLDRTEFPKLTTVKNAGATEDLAIFVTKYGDYSHIIMMDNNGVPRFRRRIADWLYAYFRVHPGETHPRARYSYLKYGSSYNPDGVEMVVLDKYLEVEDDDIHILSPFRNTDVHDQMVLPNGDYVLLAYSPARRDLRFLNAEYPALRNGQGNLLGRNEGVQDSAIQIRTAAGRSTFDWNSFDHMAIEDCIISRSFRNEYAHINSLSWFDGDIIAGFRHCSRILRIDVDTGDVVWRAGPSIHSRAEWEAGETVQSDRGPAPLDFVNDPENGFSGQHGGHVTVDGNLLVFDNDTHCGGPPGVPANANGLAECGTSTRAVEYAIDTVNKELVFQRDFRRGPGTQGGPAGHAEPLPNGDWWVSWSNAQPLSNSAVQVDAETDARKLVVTAELIEGGRGVYPIRVTANSPVALAPRVEPLEATTLRHADFHAGAADRPRVIVAFNQPVVDVAAASSSVTVAGATVAAAAHIEAGAAAHAYAFTLTPTGSGEIRFALNAGRDCASGGVCTAAGGAIESAPAEIVIPGPVAVTMSSDAYTVTEGEGVNLTAELNRGHGRAGALNIPIQVQGGSAASGVDFSVPASLAFGPTDTTGTVNVTAAADKLVEGDETVTLGFSPSLPQGVTAGATIASTVTVIDATDDTISLAAGRSEVAEGNSVDLTLSTGAGITFTTDQTIELAVAGSARDADYTLSVGGGILTAPYAATLPAGRERVVVALRIVQDATAEDEERLAVTATHGGASVGTETITIPANGTSLPKITVQAPSASPRPTEGTALVFTLRRTEATTAQLPVTVAVAEVGDMLRPNPPTTATFDVGSATARVSVPTADDAAVEEASEVTLSVIASGSTTYEAGSPQSATVTVADNDKAALGISVTPESVAEGDAARIEVAVENGVTFAGEQTIALRLGGTAAAGDYTLSAGGSSLTAPWALTLPAGDSSAGATLTVTDDEEREDAETLIVSAAIEEVATGDATLTIQASDAPPRIGIAAAQAEATEGSVVEFTVTRTNPTEPTELPELTVPLTVTAASNRIETTPSSVSFGVDSTSETLSLRTTDDTVVQAGEEEVTVTLTAEPGARPSYVVAGPGVARVGILDDDRPEFALSVESTLVAEGEEVAVAVSISNGVTFEAARTITLFSHDGRGNASYGSDYTVVNQRGAEAENLNLRPNRDSVSRTVRVVDDALSEAVETIRIAAALDGRPIAAPVTIAIAASDGHPDTLLPPEIDTATIDGNELTLLYTKPLDGDSRPATGDFVVTVAGSARGVSSLRVSGAEVHLTLASAASHGERVEIGYTPGTNPLRDIDGNAARSESGVTAVETILSMFGGGAREGEPVPFRVVTSRAVGTPVELEWSLSGDGAASPGIDFEENQAGKVTVDANATSATIEIRTIDDDQAEPNEAFTLTLTEPTGFPSWARLDVAEASGTIENDDGPMAAPPAGPGGGGGPQGGDEDDDGDGDGDDGDGDGDSGGSGGGSGGGGGGPQGGDEDDDSDGDGSGDSGGSGGDGDGDGDGDGGGGPQGGDEDDDSDGSGDGDGDGEPPRAAIATAAECEDALCRARTGEPVRLTNASTGNVRQLSWDFGDGGTSRSPAPSHSWATPGFYEVTLWTSDGARVSTASLTFLVEAAAPAGTCIADARTRCLRNSRYSVTVDWKAGDGADGAASVVPEGTNDSGLFRFFSRENWEVLIKVLDGCTLNGHAWVFGASTTDLGYLIRVTDTATGAVKEYRNEPGVPAPAITDARAFPESCRPNVRQSP